MIRQFLFSLNKEKMFTEFFEIMGYLKYSKEENSFLLKNKKAYSASIRYFIRKEKAYHYLPKDNIVEMMLLMVKAKVAIISNKLELAQQYLKETNKIIYEINDENSFVSLKDIFLFTRDYLLIEIENLLFILKIENIFKPIKEKIEHNRKIIKHSVDNYKNVELNSPEHLVLARAHLEAVVENNRLLQTLRINEEDSLYREGEKLITKIELLKNKLVNSQFIKKEKGQIVVENNRLYHYFLYSRILSEEIKLNYYLGKDKQELFYNVNKLAKIQIETGNYDPLGFIFNYSLTDILFNHSVYFLESTFNDYIKSYIIEIYKEKNNPPSFRLKQMVNFVAQEKNERIKIIEI